MLGSMSVLTQLTRSRTLVDLTLRCFACSSVVSQQNAAIDRRNADIGKSLFEAAMVSNIVRTQPSIDAQHTFDIVAGAASCPRTAELFTSALPTDTAHTSFSSSCPGNHLFATLGQLRVSADSSAERDTLERARGVMDSLSEKDVHSIIKHQHPKLVLRTLNEQLNLNVRLRWTKKVADDMETFIKDGHKPFFEVTGSIANEEISTHRHYTLPPAEAIVVRDLLKRLEQEVSDLDVNSLEFELEEDISLGCVFDEMRVIRIDKQPDEPLGILLKGGELQRTRNEKYQRLMIMSPVYVQGFVEGGAAERCGKLRVGDTLVAVDDHKLTGLSHHQCIDTLKKVAASDSVELRVRYDDGIIMDEEIRSRMNEQTRERVHKQLSTSGDHWKTLHLAKARQLPDEYASGNIQHDIVKKHKVPWRPTRKNCIWRPRGLNPIGIPFR